MIRMSIILTCLGTLTCLQATAQNDQVLFTIAGSEVTLEEFNWMYGKNKGTAVTGELEAGEYLNSFIDFKLKLREAKEQGLDTIYSISSEIKKQEDELTRQYTPGYATREDMIRLSYERAKHEIKASHILISIRQNATPEDTLMAYEKIMDLYHEAVAGEDFEILAREHSDDRAAKENGGMLDYVTVFSVIYPFETVAYGTPVGEVSKPFRSSYGYHILKVHEKRLSRGKVKVAHIFVATSPEMTEEQLNEAEEKITAAYDQMYHGRDWEETAREYSQDRGNGGTFGELGWLESGQIEPEFMDAAFSLGKRGDFCYPLQTEYGWHIIKLLDRKRFGKFYEERPELLDNVIRFKRVEQHNEIYFTNLKLKNGLQTYPDALDPVFESADSSLLAGKWEGGMLRSDKNPLLKTGTATYTTGDFVRYVEVNQDAERRAREARYYVNELFGQFLDYCLLDYERSSLPERYPEYGHLRREFREGTLLFEIMNRQVWLKALEDTAGLQQFYRDHSQEYMWGERYDATIVTCMEGVKAKKVRKKHKMITAGNITVAELNEKYCYSDTITCITVSRVMTEKGSYPQVDVLKGETGPGPVYSNENSNGFVILHEIRPPEVKTLMEVRGLLVSDYQKHLEKVWMEEIRKKYPVKVNKTLLSTMD